MLLRLLDQADGLDGKHRKHAGHQIQDQSAEDGEQHEHRQSRSVRLGAPAPAAAEPAARIAARRCDGRAAGATRSRKIRGDLDGNRDGLVAALLGREQHAANRSALRRLIADFHRELDRAVAARQRLRRGVLDAAVVVGIESERLDLRRASRPRPCRASAPTDRREFSRWSRAGAALGSSPRAAANKGCDGRDRGRRLRAVTGSCKLRSALSGMQTSAHTSQLAFAARSSGAPALRSGAAVICTRCMACLA